MSEYKCPQCGDAYAAEKPWPCPACSYGSELASSAGSRLTPETDDASMAWYGNKDVVQGDFARMLERERDEARRWNAEGKINGARCAEERDRLQDAIRTLRDAKGNTATQDAYEKLIALLPENDEMTSTHQKH